MESKAWKYHPPPLHDLSSQAKKVNADVIVTIGGGSLTDGAKVVRIALETRATHGDELGKYWLSVMWNFKKKNKLFGWLELVLFFGCQKITEDPGEIKYENMKSASNKV